MYFHVLHFVIPINRETLIIKIEERSMSLWIVDFPVITRRNKRPHCQRNAFLLADRQTGLSRFPQAKHRCDSRTVVCHRKGNEPALDCLLFVGNSLVMQQRSSFCHSTTEKYLFFFYFFLHKRFIEESSSTHFHSE